MINRKVLVAAATALAVGFSGATYAVANETNAPANGNTETNADASATSETTSDENAADGAPATDDSSQDTNEGNQNQGNQNQGNQNQGNQGNNNSNALGSSGSSDMKPAEIREWIAVITAVIGALSAAYTFFNRYILN